MSEPELCTKRDLNLEVMAKNIFGHDIVKSAYVLTWKFGACTAAEKDKRLLQKSFKKVSEEIDEIGMDVVICFTNGNSVRFAISEWGSISNVDLTKVEIRP